MKKILLIFSILLLVACSGQNQYKVVKSSDIMTKIDNKESFILLVASDSCAACKAFTPTVEEVIKNKKIEVLAVKLDREKVKSDGKTEDPEGVKNVTKLLEQYLSNRVTGTPTMLLIKDGAILDIKVGIQTYTQLLAWLQGHGYVK